MKNDYSGHQNLAFTISNHVNTFEESREKDTKEIKDRVKKAKDALDFSSSKFKKLQKANIFDYLPINFTLMLGNELNTDMQTA